MLSQIIGYLKSFRQKIMALSNKFIGQINLFFSKLTNKKYNDSSNQITADPNSNHQQFASKKSNFQLFHKMHCFLSKDAFKEYLSRIKKNKIFSEIYNELIFFITGVDDKDTENQPEGMLGICINGRSIILMHLISNLPELTVKSSSIVEFNTTDLNFQNPMQKLEIQKIISEYIQTNRLSKVKGSYVLTNSQYVISLVELPSDSKITRDRAILWSVKDYINYSIDDAIIDSFDIPINRTQDNVSLAYATIMRARLSQDLGELINSCGIKLKYIDINELCIRNILKIYPALREQGCLVLKIFDNYSNILLIKEDALFISRITKLNIKQLDNFDPMQDNVPEKLSIAEGILLELQRSLDYGNNMFRGLNCNSVCILPCGCNLEKIVIWLKEQSGLQITQLDLTTAIKFESSVQLNLDFDWVLAVGAALRDV